MLTRKHFEAFAEILRNTQSLRSAPKAELQIAALSHVIERFLPHRIQREMTRIRSELFMARHWRVIQTATQYRALYAYFLADFFRQENPRFDFDRFFAAARVDHRLADRIAGDYFRAEIANKRALGQ